MCVFCVCICVCVCVCVCVWLKIQSTLFCEKPDVVVFSGCSQCADSVFELFGSFRLYIYLGNVRKFPIVSVLFAGILPLLSMTPASFFSPSQKKTMLPPFHFESIFLEIPMTNSMLRDWKQTIKAKYYEWKCEITSSGLKKKKKIDFTRENFPREKWK